MASGYRPKIRSRTIPSKRPESVLIVVKSLKGQVLCLRRRDDPTFWQSVTGSLLEQEMPMQAAMRELEEETGFSTVHGKLTDCQTQWWFTIYPHWRHRYAPGTTQNLEHVFVFTLDETQTVHMSDEHTEYRWLPKEQALELVRSKTNQQAIELFVEEN